MSSSNAVVVRNLVPNVVSPDVPKKMALAAFADQLDQFGLFWLQSILRDADFALGHHVSDAIYYILFPAVKVHVEEKKGALQRLLNLLGPFYPLHLQNRGFRGVLQYLVMLPEDEFEVLAALILQAWGPEMAIRGHRFIESVREWFAANSSVHSIDLEERLIHGIEQMAEVVVDTGKKMSMGHGPKTLSLHSHGMEHVDTYSEDQINRIMAIGELSIFSEESLTEQLTVAARNDNDERIRSHLAVLSMNTLCDHYLTKALLRCMKDTCDRVPFLRHPFCSILKHVGPCGIALLDDMAFAMILKMSEDNDHTGVWHFAIQTYLLPEMKIREI